MENKGDKILGIWTGEIMGVIFRFEFVKDGENVYGGKLIDVKVPFLLKPLAGAKGMNPDEAKNVKLFSFFYEPEIDAYNLGDINKELSRKADKPLPKGMSFQAEQISRENMVLRFHGLGINRTLNLQRDRCNT